MPDMSIFEIRLIFTAVPCVYSMFLCLGDGFSSVSAPLLTKMRVLSLYSYCMSLLGRQVAQL